MEMQPNEIVTHIEPAWADRADFLIHADISEPPLPKKLEQLSCMQTAADRFIICCIPFFLYDVSLGDEVRTRSEGSRRYLLHEVVRTGGHFTFRVWLEQPDGQSVGRQIVEGAALLGCLHECYSNRLFALDAPNEQVAEQLSGYLLTREEAGEIRYETGKL